MFRYLLQHPKIVSGVRKEVHYFDRSYNRGELWYRAHFPLSLLRARDSILGEATPQYSFYPHAAQRIRELLPDVKLIFMLRDPVRRALSHYAHARRAGIEPLAFKDAIASEAERTEADWQRMVEDPSFFSRDVMQYSYARRGLYADQLNRVLEVFPRERVMVISSEDMFDQPGVVVNSVLAFLEQQPLKGLDDEIHNAAGSTAASSVVDSDTLAHLKKLFLPQVEMLERFVGDEFGWF